MSTLARDGTSPVTTEDDLIVVLCTAPSEDVAADLARGLVGERLAACVNVIPGMRSFYRWEGKVHDDQEVQLIIKTRRDHFSELQAWIHSHHPYDVPEVVAHSVAHVSDVYAEWLRDQTGG